MSHDTSWRPITLSIGANPSLFSLNCATIEDSNTTKRSPRDVTSIRGVSHRSLVPMSEIDCTTSLKRCGKCREEYPATTEFFTRSSASPDGLYSICKPCKRQYRLDNRDKELARHRLWQKRHADELADLYRVYRQRNPARRERVLRWVRENPLKIQLYIHRYKARKQGLPDTFAEGDAKSALDYFNGRCAVCERPLHDLFGTHKLHWDHWIPLSKGGGTTPSNMIPLCGGIGGCNNSKHDHMPIDWLASRYPAKKAKAILSRIEAYFEYIKSLAVQS